MSSVPVAPPVEPARSLSPNEVKIYMHSGLLYWWPVWAVGFLMALWTYVENRHMALVPQGATVNGPVLVAPAGGSVELTGMHVSASRLPGALFALTLLGVIAFGGGWMRGWRAYTFAVSFAAVLLLISWMRVWGEVAALAAYVCVYISLGGYLVISTGLLALWLVQLLVVDRRRYFIFTLSQVRVHNEIGEEEMAYDVQGVSFEKQPYDWFRWLVGFGAGDLRVLVGGKWLEILNVMHVGRQLGAIETLLRTRDVQ